VFQKFAVFRDAAVHAFSPECEAGGLELPAHDIDHRPFREAGALLDLLKACSVLPRKSDHQRDLVGMNFGLHGIY